MPFPPGVRSNGPIRPGARRPGVSGRPASPAPSQALAIHFEMAAAQFARSVANSQRYLVALRADQAYDRLARQDGRYHLPRGTQRYLNELRHPLSPAWLSQHAQPTAFVGPAATEKEKWESDMMANNSTEVGLMIRTDIVQRSIAGAAVVVGGAVVMAAALTEEAAAYSAWRWIGWRAALLRFSANAAGQHIGYYASTGNNAEAFSRINWVSPFLSAGGVPMMTSAIGAGAFKLDFGDGYRSVFNGKVTGSEAARDAVVGYGFNQVTRLSGFDNLHRSPAATNLVGGLRYQISLRLTSQFPRFAQSIDAGIETITPEVLEVGNRAASSAVRKAGAIAVKKRLPK